MNTAVATTEGANVSVQIFRQELGSMEGQFHAALPAHIPVERFVRVLQTAVQQNPDLLKCTRRSLWNAAMKAAQDGLLPDGREGAIVPYKGSAQWMPMIAGIRKKVRNSGEIATWDAHVVYENDAFQFALGDEPRIVHEPALGDRGKPIAAYSIAVLKSGEKSREVMSVAEIESVRSRSAAKNSGPWVTDWSEMARKTVARRHSKVLPMSTDLDDLMRRDDDLYQFDEAKQQAAATGRSTLSERMDALASLPSTNSLTPDAATEQQPEQESEVMHAAKTQESVGDTGPAGAPQNASGATPPERIEPQTAEEYIGDAERWIISATNAADAETRWRNEKQLRSRLGVSVDDAKALAEKLTMRCKAIRG